MQYVRASDVLEILPRNSCSPASRCSTWNAPQWLDGQVAGTGPKVLVIDLPTLREPVGHPQHERPRLRIDAGAVVLPAVGAGDDQHPKGAFGERQAPIVIIRLHFGRRADSRDSRRPGHRSGRHIFGPSGDATGGGPPVAFPIVSEPP